jgi:putative dimethyl sulfoxide reductase chaperone
MTMKSDNKQANLLKGYNMLLYFSGTMIMFDPSQECIHDFWTRGILKTLPVTSNNPRFVLAASQLRESVGDETHDIKSMKKDYLELFAGTGRPLAPPYESVYKSKDHLMFEKQTSEVREFYGSYGWVSKFKGNIPDDHLGIEMLFLTLMIEKYLEFDDKTCEDEMKNEIRRFINLHLLSWIPEWNKHLQEHSKTMGYKGIGNLVCACVEDIYGLMSSAEPKYN